MTEYDLGDSVRVSTEFRVNSVLTDPTSVTFKTKSPSGVIATYVFGDGSGNIAKDGVGRYRADIALLEAGIWSYRWQGAGAAQAAEERQIRVRKSVFP